MTKVKKNKTTRRYSNEDLQNALEAIKKGKSVRIVSKEFNIPKSTLSDKKRGVSKPVVIKPGPQSILGEKNEARLVQWIFYMSEKGFPVTKDHVQTSVQRLVNMMKLENVFNDNRPRRHWYAAFKQRHPELCERLSQNMMCTRAAVTEEKIREWFHKVEGYLESKNLLNVDPSRIFNCDEAGFRLCPQGVTVLVKRGDRSAYSFVHNDEKECITTLFGGNDAGQLVDPMVMFPYVRIPSSVSSLMPKDFCIGRSETGWMTAQAFFEWMGNCFYPWLLRNKIEFPVILYLDGHSSHLTLELSDWCRSKSIELVALYPNSTHILQPFDVAVFHPLKVSWRTVVPEWRMEHNGERLKREHFSAVLKRAMERLKWQGILQSGFRATGLYPFSPDAINYDKQLKRSTQETSAIPGPTDQLNLTYVEFVESNINKEVLEAFKVVKDNEEWTGEVDHKSLFSFWRRVKNYESSNRVRNTTESARYNVPDQAASADTNSQEERNESITSPEGPENTSPEFFSKVLEDLSTIYDTSEVLGNDLEGQIYELNEKVEMVPLNKFPNQIDSIVRNLNSEFGVSGLNDDFNLDENHNIVSLNKESNTECFVENNQVTQMTEVSDNDKDAEKVNQETEVLEKNQEQEKVTESQSSTGQSTGDKDHLAKNIPSPFENCLFWPSAPKKPLKKRPPKEQLPAVVTSDAWNFYHKDKIEKAEKKKEEIKRKKQKRARTRELKAHLKEAAALARKMKKEKIEEKKKRKEAATGKKKSPTLFARKRGRKRKLPEMKIKNQNPAITKEVKQELLYVSFESNVTSNSPSAKSTPAKKMS